VIQQVDVSVTIQVGRAATRRVNRNRAREPIARRPDETGVVRDEVGEIDIAVVVRIARSAPFAIVGDRVGVAVIGHELAFVGNAVGVTIRAEFERQVDEIGIAVAVAVRVALVGDAVAVEVGAPTERDVAFVGHGVQIAVEAGAGADVQVIADAIGVAVRGNRRGAGRDGPVGGCPRRLRFQRKLE